jgi:HYR domain/Secretion system C-terminal sorting domain
MKKIYYFFASLATCMLLYSYSPTSEGGKTGSNGAPGESTCANCHGGAAGGSATLTSDIPLNGFVPGATYNMVFTVSQTGQPLFGMGLESLSATNTQAGTLVAGTGTQVLVKSLKQNLIHTLNGGLSSGSKAFAFKWTAPAVAAGNVTFYYAGLAADGDGVENSTDNTYAGNKVFSPQAVSVPTVLTVNCPTDVTMATAAGATTAIATYTAPTGTSTCTTGSVTVTKTSGLASGAAFPIGTTPIAYTITDGCGNTKTCSFNVIVTATAAPAVLTVNCPTDVTMATAAGATTAIATYTAPTGTSTCTTGSVTVTKTSGLASGAAFPIGTTPIAYTITDGCGNTKTCSFNVIVTATAAPAVLTVVCPTDVTMATAAGATTAIATYTAPTGTSTCTTGSVTVTKTSGLASGAAFPIGTTPIVYTITDGCGNTKTCSFNVIVKAGQAQAVLTVVCPTDVSLTAVAGATTALATYTAPTGTSTCTTGSVTVTKTSGLASGAAFPIGTTPIVYTITDGCGNTKTCSFNVIVKAATPIPTVLTVVCPTDVNVTVATGATTAIANYTVPTGTSTCTTGSVTVTKTSGLASGVAFPIGSTPICYTITDGCGNTKTCCFNVIVKAGQAVPVLTVNCPTDITLTAATGTATAVVTYTAPTGTSTCTTGTVTVTKTSGLASGASFPIGTTQICYTITDGCGNSKKCCFNVVVKAAGTATVCSKIEFEGEEGVIKITNLPKESGYAVGIKLTNAVTNVVVLQCLNCSVNKESVKIKNLTRNGVYTVQVDLKQNGVAVCKRTETLSLKEGGSGANGNQSLVGIGINPNEQVLFAEPLGIYTTNTFRVSPNPASDEVNVEVKQFKGRAVTIMIANKFGQVVKTQQVREATDSSVPVSLDNIPEGFYTITLLAKGESKANKLVVQKYQ